MCPQDDRNLLTHLDMYPCCETLPEVDFEPPHQGAKLLLLVSVQLCQFIFTL